MLLFPKLTRLESPSLSEWLESLERLIVPTCMSQSMLSFDILNFVNIGIKKCYCPVSYYVFLIKCIEFIHFDNH